MVSRGLCKKVSMTLFILYTLTGLRAKATLVPLHCKEQLAAPTPDLAYNM